MFKKVLLFLLFLITNNSFTNLPSVIVSKNKIKTNMLLDNNFNIFDLNKEKTMGKFIVKSLSDSLSQFDSISHIVLNSNSRIIHETLKNDIIPDQIKKDIILLTIKITQEGDNMGSQILELYYNIVDKVL